MRDPRQKVAAEDCYNEGNGLVSSGLPMSTLESALGVGAKTPTATHDLNYRYRT